MSEPAAEPDLFSRMQQAGFAEFALSCAVHGITLTSDRERELVDTALAAGVVGALAILRGDQDDPDADPSSTRH